MDNRPANHFSLWLDCFRWVAAFLVLFAHITNRFMMPSSDLHEMGFRPFRYAYSFLSGFSHQAVIVFFVLSGFLVGGGLVREFERTGQIDIGAYAVKRLARLWTVLIPTFVLSFICQSIAATNFAAGMNHVASLNIGDQSNLTGLVCNLAFMQTALCEPYAGNGPLWSLFNEFWYYAVWPLLFLALASKLNISIRIFCALVATALLVGLTYLQFTGSSFGPYMSLWLIGVGAAVIKRPLVSSPLISATLLALFVLAVRLAIRRDSPMHSPIGTFVVDSVLAVLFGHLVLTMRVARALASPPFGVLNKKFADFSFTLYCVHVPLLNLYLAAVVDRIGYGWQMTLTSPSEWSVLVTPLFAVPVFAFGFSWITERHTDKVKTLAMRIFLRSKVAHAD